MKPTFDFNSIKNYPDIDLRMVEAKVNEICSAKLRGYSQQDSLKLILSLIDLTTLEGSDTEEKVIKLAEKAAGFSKINSDYPNTAAVCVYPTLVRIAKNKLKGTGVKVASVAGAFPAGQSPLSIKVAEVKYAVEEGADEIDMVISRGKFLEGRYEEVFDEIVAIKQACGKARLKVILETGELVNLRNVRIASDLAIYAGADFIKTSTGKIQVGATLPSVYVMLQSIREYYLKTEIKVGMKPAGGISDTATALNYLKLAYHIAGEDWLTPEWFRFGASRLADVVLNELQGNTQKIEGSGY